MTNRYNHKPLLFYIFQYHNNNTANSNNINVHLTVIVSLRVTPLLAYGSSNFAVILLLFLFCCLDFPYPNLTTASLYLYTFMGYCEIGILSGSHNFMNHFRKLGSYTSIFMRSRNIKNSSWGIMGVMILVLIPITN